MNENFKMTVPDNVRMSINKIGLIDADFIKYIVTYRISKNPRKTLNGDTPTAMLVTEILDVIDNILPHIECKEKVYCFSGPTTRGFRYMLSQDKEYKGASRKKKEPAYPTEQEDAHFVFNYICDNYTSLYYQDIEADDLLSMLQCDETFIYSKDKDMLQIPGDHYNINESKFIEVTPQESWAFLMNQCITGDSTDNIAGIKGLGPAKASGILDGYPTEELHNVVLQKYIEHFGIRRGLDQFVEMYSLLRLYLNRGEWLREKYADAFQLIETLKLVK